MGADYLISSLPSISLDAPAQTTAEKFLALVREQLSAKDAAAVETIFTDAQSDHKLVLEWRDLETQLRNAIATERARAKNVDAAKWIRSAAGCSLYWRSRVIAAYQEKDLAKRDRLIDGVLFDAAGELTNVASPLSVGAVFTYAIRLRLALRRNVINVDAGNEVFNRLTAASAPSSVLKE